MKYVVGGYSQLSYGTEDRCFEFVLNNQIRPVLTMLYNNPSMKFLLRLSMAEYEWLEYNHPEINMLINNLCKKNQLELLSSSYYDSDLSLVPSHERSSHVEKSTAYLRKNFSKRPHGFWFSYQVFNPSVIPVMELSSLDYIVISSYNQSNKTVLNNKPFCMSEMGKSTVVFPTDDKLSKLVNDAIKNDYKSEKLNDEVKKIVKSSSNVLSTFFINLDNLARIDDSSCIFNTIFKTAGSSCILPSEYLNDHEISKYYYMPTGVYGRDYSIGKALSVNEKILEDNILSKNYFTLENIRNIIRNNRKVFSGIKLVDELLMEASSSSLYLPLYSEKSSYRKYVSSRLCELEKIIYENNLLPNSIDVSFNHNSSDILASKNMFAYISSKDAVVNKLCLLHSNTDITLNSESGLFYDNIKTVNGLKTVNLANRKFDVFAFDRKKNEYSASCPVIELGDYRLCLIKKYKLKQNILFVEYEVKNISEQPVKDCSIEVFFNLSFNNDSALLFDSNIVKNIDYSNASDDLKLSVIFDSETTVSTKPVYVNYNSCSGIIKDYQYTQFKFEKTISLRPMESLCFSVNIKVDKYKEKNNDIKQ